MKPFVIKRNSWHFRLAAWKFSWLKHSTPTDFCTYARRVFWAMMTAAVIAVVLAVLFSSIAVPIAMTFVWAYKSIVAGALVPLPLAALVFWILVGGALTAGAFAFGSYQVARLIQLYQQRKYNRKYNHEHPGFVRTWWSTFRGKFCIPVVMEGNK